ncbi:CbrC family protein [Streptomyces sp. NPDC052610]|uniref:CbrC family protein n=1 Tax=Streptomyces sp. NPDC052610 TaxID=3154952 RepID=UPI003416B9DE
MGGASGSRALAEGRRGPGPGRSTNWAWQDPHWLIHCQDAAAFVGEVGYSELAAHPEALDQLRADLSLDGQHDEDQLEKFLADLGSGATAMLFRCTVCGAHLAYADAS